MDKLQPVIGDGGMKNSYAELPLRLASCFFLNGDVSSNLSGFHWESMIHLFSTTRPSYLFVIPSIWNPRVCTLEYWLCDGLYTSVSFTSTYNYVTDSQNISFLGDYLTFFGRSFYFDFNMTDILSICGMSRPWLCLPDGIFAEVSPKCGVICI